MRMNEVASTLTLIAAPREKRVERIPVRPIALHGSFALQRCRGSQQTLLGRAHCRATRHERHAYRVRSSRKDALDRRGALGIHAVDLLYRPAEAEWPINFCRIPFSHLHKGRTHRSWACSRPLDRDSGAPDGDFQANPPLD